MDSAHHHAMDLLSEPTLFQFLARLFTSDFMPHGHCFFWRPEILWLHVVSDFIIGLSYYLIPFALFQFVRKRKDLVFNWIFILFAIFILACGTTHFMNIWTMWHGTYRLDGMVKLLTALASILTASLLYPLIPKALALKSPLQLEREVRQRTQELREANKSLEGMTSKLEEFNRKILRSNKELEQFAYVASHDLQEPMRTVGNYVDLLGARIAPKLSDEEKEYLRFALEGARRAQAVIRDLLGFSRVGTDKEEFRDTDMNLVAQKAVDNLRTQIDQAGADVHVEPLPIIQADNLQMLQLLQNLISNAVKYRGENPCKIQIFSGEETSQWIFTVKDNGIGIAPQYHEKVFEIFQRLHDRKKYDGTGMGLSICRKIIELHRGKIWIESDLGVGTRFIFTIPKTPLPGGSSQAS